MEEEERASGDESAPAPGASRDEVVLDTPARWKAVSHPLRLEILRILGDGPKTNEELARAMGTVSGKLHFHTRTLLNAGLIEPAGTRQKGSVTEKLYRRAASGFAIPMIEDGTAPPLLHFIQNAVHMYDSTWRETPSERRDFLQFGYHVMYHHTLEQTRAFCDRLTRLLHDFEDTAVDPETPGARLVSLGVIIHQMLEHLAQSANESTTQSVSPGDDAGKTSE